MLRQYPVYNVSRETLRLHLSRNDCDINKDVE